MLNSKSSNGRLKNIRNQARIFNRFPNVNNADSGYSLV